MEYRELLEAVYNVAKQYAERGAGYSQQRVVLDEASRQLFNRDPFITPANTIQEQAILTCWHDLFREGRLSWGYNLDNPDAPFFHIPRRDSQTKLAG
jgi:hypothetical protein